MIDRPAARRSASPARLWAQGVGMAREDRQGEGLALELSIADSLTRGRLRRGEA